MSDEAVDVAATERALRHLGKARTRHREAAERASEEARPLIIQLRRAGVPAKRIAEVGGYNPRAIQDILREAGLTRRRK